MADLLVIYRPELENPPRQGSIAIAPSLKDEPIVINPGTNRGVSRDAWDSIKKTPLIGKLLAIGAIEAAEATESIPEAAGEPVSEISDLPVDKAIVAIDHCWEIETLNSWLEIDKRIKIRNRINERIAAINEGRA